MLQEFKEFISRGNVLATAVGLVMALYFQAIIDAVLDGLIYPIIAATFGEQSLGDIGFAIGDAHISIGLVIDAAIKFVIVAFVLFLLVKAYNARVAKPEETSGPTEIELLIDIRDALRTR